MSRILGLDLGTRTIGIAISDNLEMIASAVETYRFKENDFESALKKVVDIVNEKKIHKIVLGYPKHMNGDIGDKALLCEEFRNKIIEELGIEVVLFDERWTTKLAQNRLLEFDLSRNKRKKIIDKMAAVVILQNYLDGNRGGKIIMDDKILITKEDGTEIELTILLTFESKELGYKYVLYYDENDENGEVLPFRYNEETHELSELESEEEWELANEVLESFLDEQ